jgi:peptidoglycan L-alanyl-D-glutamate endopeptidase CwlK
MTEDKYAGLEAGFRTRIETFEAKLKQAGIHAKIVQGYRSIEEQNRLYAQGRTAPGKIVTNAPGGESWHNYGLAADYAFVKSDGSITWNGPWDVFGSIARSCGLEWGGDFKGKFKDRPHVQWRNGKTLAEMRMRACD